jgi:peptidoglycan/LPS O-acetylase OafA/YrhL
MSYSYFLVHGLVLHGSAFALALWLPPAPLPAGLFPAILAMNLLLTLAGALVLFVLVEKRFSLGSGKQVGASGVVPGGGPQGVCVAGNL